MMKKSLASLAVAGVFAAAGSANAALNLQNDGIGHILIVPYFTTQNGNSTLLNLVNTDTVNGKAVKVRFRGGKDSDDIYDFQVFMSPGDVWTANVSQNASGLSTLTTSDLTCTLPAASVLNATPFVTSRLSTTDATSGAGTREGYVEIFNMADLRPGDTTTSPIYATVKHTSAGGAPTCSTTILENIETTYATVQASAGAIPAATRVGNAGGTSTGMWAPTTGLMANWTIINVPNSTTFSGNATAIEANTATRIVYSQQTGTTVTATVAETTYPGIRSTFDGALLTSGFATAEFDFPDLSTPYETATISAGAQIYALSSTIAHTTLVNEFILDSAISGSTDWLVSMPTRRYFVAGRGTGATSAATGTYAGANTTPLRESEANSVTHVCTNETAGVLGVGNAYGACGYAPVLAGGTVAKTGAQGFFASVTTYAADNRSSCVGIGGYSMYSREEQTTVGTTAVVSPGSVTNVELCGEVNILSLNNLTTNTRAVGANLTVAGLSIPYSSGWASVNLNKDTKLGGLPVIGFAFVKAVNPAVSAGVSGNFGGTWGHRWTDGKH